MANHFLVEQYVESCKICGTYPNKKWTQQFFSGSLIIDVPKLIESDCEVLSHTISKFQTPFSISIICSGNIHNDKLIYKKILKAVARSVQISRSLIEVSFKNCNLYSDLLSLLCQGLKASTVIETLLFNKCKFSTRFSGLESLCVAIKNVASISKFALDNCSLHAEDAVVIKNLIMHQGMNRTSFMWHETLRFQEPELDSYIGLRHIILNNNPSLGDDGLDTLITEMEDDIWITGIELENCGIQTAGANKILQLLRTNEIINYINIDRNPFIDKSVIEEISNILKERTDLEWNPQNSPYLSEQSNPEDKMNIGVLKEVIGHRKKLCSKLATRTRASRKRFQSTSPIRSPATPIEEGSNWEQVYILLFREMRERFQSELKRETERRHKVERKLEKREQKIKLLKERLNSGFLVEEQTMIHIENSFTKFQQFLIKLKQAEDDPTSYHDPTGSEVDSLKNIVSVLLEKSSKSDFREFNHSKNDSVADSNKACVSLSQKEVIDKQEKNRINQESTLVNCLAKSVLQQESRNKSIAGRKDTNELLDGCETNKDNGSFYNKSVDESNYLVIDREVGNIPPRKETDGAEPEEQNSSAPFVHIFNEEQSYETCNESEDASSSNNKPDDSKVSSNFLSNIKFVNMDINETSDRSLAVGNAKAKPYALSETDEEKLKILETKNHFQSNSNVPQSLSNQSSYTEILTEDLSGVEDLSITTLSSL